MTHECKKSFVLYADYKRHLDLIESAEEYRALFDSVFEYCLTGYEPENLRGMAMMAFSFIKADIDRNCAKYENVKEKRREAGRRGGMAKAANAEQTEQRLANVANARDANDCQANVPDNVTVNGNVNGNGTDTLIKIVPIGTCPQQAVDQCPHQAIVDLYHEVLPELPRVKSWNEKRQKHLRARWREKTERQSLDFWKRYFEYVRKSPFLMGQRNSPGRAPFVCTLEWLVTQSNFTNVIEEKYHSER